MIESLIIQYEVCCPGFVLDVSFKYNIMTRGKKFIDIWKIDCDANFIREVFNKKKTF